MIFDIYIAIESILGNAKKGGNFLGGTGDEEGTGIIEIIQGGDFFLLDRKSTRLNSSHL